MRETTYAKKGAETVRLAGRSFDTLVLEAVDRRTGVVATMWLDGRTGMAVRTRAPGNSLVYLAAALARRVGIPARAVVGTAYAPLQGGTFGRAVIQEGLDDDANACPSVAGRRVRPLGGRRKGGRGRKGRTACSRSSKRPTRAQGETALRDCGNGLPRRERVDPGSLAPAAGSRALHLGVLGGVSLLLALLLHRKARSLAQTDYSTTTKEFLAEAEQRYRLVRPLDLAYAIPLLFILALTGGRLVLDVLVPRYVQLENAAVVVWGYGIFFLAICGLGSYFTYANWQREHGTMWAEIRRMRQEME